jgi:hypothetical protein
MLPGWVAALGLGLGLEGIVGMGMGSMLGAYHTNSITSIFVAVKGREYAHKDNNHDSRATTSTISMMIMRRRRVMMMVTKAIRCSSSSSSPSVSGHKVLGKAGR